MVNDKGVIEELTLNKQTDFNLISPQLSNYSSLKENTVPGGDKSVSPAYSDEAKASYSNTDNGVVNT